ncbi:alkaline phosphatase family protein [Turicibacter sp. TJ11]|uniref:alkaline phosphatase family protein n=1 Tax=Turicibacter sp. TJ11 TaxID=2806443 RepID=UPI001F1CF151|nr:alkaline phosphatase family protein [Turicibacter sp. TJ11]
MKTIIYPNYERCILNTMATIMNYYGIKTGHQTLPEVEEVLGKKYKNVVLMVFDGMGIDALEKNLKPSDFLNQQIKAELTSVVPSTTTAAMTAYYGGKSPFEHGWLGWSLYFKEYGRCIDTFINTDSYTGEALAFPHAGHELMGYTHVCDQVEATTNHEVKAYMVEPSYINYRGKNQKIGVDDAKGFFKEVEKLCQTDEEKFVFAYWTDPDKTMHSTGCYSKETKEKLQEINDLLKQLSETMEDTLILVSADHGLIDVEPKIYLNEYPELMDCFLMPPFIEGRLMSFFIREDLKDVFKERFNQLFSDDFILLTRQEALEKGLFGPGQPHKKTLDFIGDFIACATSTKLFDYMPVIKTKKFEFTATHAGLTREEMLVPLIVVESK